MDLERMFLKCMTVLKSILSPSGTVTLFKLALLLFSLKIL